MSDLNLWDIGFDKDFYLDINSEISFVSGNDEATQEEVKVKARKTRAKWTVTEDQILQSSYKSYGPDWDRIQNLIPNKSSQLIQKRWALRYDPNIKHSRWTREEDDKILHYFQKYGGKWIRIARKIPNRQSDSIKNRYYSVLRKRIEKNARKSEEQT